MKSTWGDAWGDAGRVRYLKTICGIVSHAIYQTDAGKPAPVFFCVRAWWIIGADPVKVRPIRAGGIRPGTSAGPIRDRHGQTRLDLERVRSPPGHVTHQRRVTSAGIARDEQEPPQDAHGAETQQGHPRSRGTPPRARKPHPERYGSRFGSQEPPQDAPGRTRSAFAGPIRETDNQPPPGLYGPFSPLPRRSLTFA